MPPADALRAGVLRAFEENATMATDVGVYLTRVEDISIPIMKSHFLIAELCEKNEE